VVAALRVPRWALTVLLLAAAVGGFLVGRQFSEPLPPVEPLPIDLGRGGRYVALGDSYSAGEGLEPFEEETRDTDKGGDRCHRSEKSAYSRLLTFVHPTTALFRACSGAIVANVYGTVQEHGGVPNHQGLQVQPEIEGSDVTLVTLTMGGNDLDFAKALTFCAKEERCADQPYKGHDSLRSWVTASVEDIEIELFTLYEQLQGSFPDARILVLGYPALFPEKAPPNRLETAACNPLFLLWTGSEREAIRDFGLLLNQAIQRAASAAAIEYVDVFSHFVGHEPCSASQWVRFVGISEQSAIRQGSFHPLPRGQAMMARIVSCHLHVFASPSAPRDRITALAMTGCVGQQTAFVFPTPEVTATPTPTTEATAAT
jgi:hypothetical protein